MSTAGPCLHAPKTLIVFDLGGYRCADCGPLKSSAIGLSLDQLSPKLIEGLLEESRPCTCGGGNDNCYHCWGTGVIQRKLEPPPFRRRKKKSKQVDVSPLIRKFGSEKAKQAAKADVLAYMISCDLCHYRGLPDEVRQHKKTDHPERQAASIPKLIDTHSSERQRRRNPESRHHKADPLPAEPRTRNHENPSGQIWRDDRYRAEAIARGLIKPASTPRPTSVKVVSGAEAERMAKPATAPIKARKKSVRCPLCHNTMGATKFAKHLKEKHGVDGSRFKSAGRKPDSGRRERNSSPVTESFDHANELQIVDEREAHRHMGFVVRENGRYGSHPLHDRFDDESEP